ncbi:hypothetical protein EGK14_14370 [Erwinia sp. 198]|nr:hypothetical protein EGK14_14370 [Erwinia sp. 198]
MEASGIKKIKAVEEENRRLRQIFAVLSVEDRALKDIIEKSFETSQGKQRLSAGNALPLPTSEALNQGCSVYA